MLQIIVDLILLNTNTLGCVALMMGLWGYANQLIAVIAVSWFGGGCWRALGMMSRGAFGSAKEEGCFRVAEGCYFKLLFAKLCLWWSCRVCEKSRMWGMIRMGGKGLFWLLPHLTRALLAWVHCCMLFCLGFYTHRALVPALWVEFSMWRTDGAPRNPVIC